jgi:hypothetical protein
MIMPLPTKASQVRAVRIGNLLAGLRYAACGGAPPPLDYVADTGGVDYPSLDLIRERGLGIIYDAPKYYGLTSDPSDPKLDLKCQAEAKEALKAGQKPKDAVTGFSELVNRVAPSWDDIGYSVENEPAAVALKAPMAECLRRGSGLTVEDDNPYVSFLQAVDASYLRRQNPVPVGTVQRWSVLYADCGAAYWSYVGTRLTAERPGVVERNREVLQSFAVNLVKAGYTP